MQNEETAISLGNHLNRVWDSKERKTDWMQLEQTLVNVLNSALTDDEKVAFCKETIDAYTRRGHFGGSNQYPDGR